MAYFRGSLYVGTSCPNVTGADDAPRILRYLSDAGKWQTVYEPPIIDPSVRSHVPDRQILNQARRGGLRNRAQGRGRGGKVPRDSGYRSMCVFQGSSDAEPALYVGAMCRTGGLLLRSIDGENFCPVGEPGLGNSDVYSLRGLTSLGGRLFAAPAGTVTDEYLDRNVAPAVKVYVSDDPASGVWAEASESHFGDPANVAIYSLCTAHGHVYAGTANPERGFQLWRTSGEGDPPFAWEPVVVDGAHAFNHNLAVTAMAEFKGALYVGSGITGFGRDKVHDVGPASAELIRVHRDGSWDLIAGRMRFTTEGLKVPLSLLGPGLGDFYNSVVWAIGAHDGALYLGTHQWEAFRSLELNADDILGGYQLWATEDGEQWELLIDDGNGNPAELGIRTLASTPLGLFVGTHNQSRLLKLLGRRKRPELAFEEGFEVLLGR